MSKKKKKPAITVDQLSQTPPATSTKKSARKNTEIDAKSAYQFVSTTAKAGESKTKKTTTVERWYLKLKAAVPEFLSQKIQGVTKNALSTLEGFEKKHLAHRSFYQNRIRPLIENFV
jgi:hypothetical protein